MYEKLLVVLRIVSCVASTSVTAVRNPTDRKKLLVFAIYVVAKKFENVERLGKLCADCDRPVCDEYCQTVTKC